MPPKSKNEDLVPNADKPFYRRATVVGLRQQLDEEDLATDGLKYDLYLRLINAGHRLYTDDRDSDEDDSDEDDSDEDDGDEDNGDADDNQQGHDQGSNPRPKGGGKRPRNSGRDSPSDDDDDDGDPQPPPRRRRGLGLPPELQIRVIQNLHPSALWTLIDTAPEEYLDAQRPGGINALIVEARGQYALDYPPPPPPVPSPTPQPDDGGQDDGDDAPQTPPDSGGGNSGGDNSGGDNSGGGSSNNNSSNNTNSNSTSSSNNNSQGNSSNDNNPDDHNPDDHDDDEDDDEVPRTMSLLEWVGVRATYDSRFRAVNRTRINRVIDAYLAVYGPNDPGIDVVNVQDDILYFFRDRNDIQNPGAGNYAHTPLTLAAMDRESITVQLLIMRGANVNQSIRGWRPLDRAVAALHTDINSAHGIQIIFTLIGAGANLGLLRQSTQRAAFELLLEFDWFDLDDVDYYNPPRVWPRINNPLGGTIRDFIADERSSYWDRVLISMYVIWAGTLDYPLFV